jgi:hypothetical protein
VAVDQKESISYAGNISRKLQPLMVNDLSKNKHEKHQKDIQKNIQKDILKSILKSILKKKAAERNLQLYFARCEI